MIPPSSYRAARSIRIRAHRGAARLPRLSASVPSLKAAAEGSGQTQAGARRMAGRTWAAKVKLVSDACRARLCPDDHPISGLALEVGDLCAGGRISNRKKDNRGLVDGPSEQTTQKS